MQTQSPTILCPVCNQHHDARDAFEMGEGSETSCSHCGAELVIAEVEMIAHWSVMTKADYEAAEAKASQRHAADIKSFLEHQARRQP
jgi:hypothetical protein